MIEAITICSKDAKRLGIRLLVNETEQLTVRGHPMQLLGLRWGRRTSRPYQSSDDAAIAASFSELLALRDPKAFPILLARTIPMPSTPPRPRNCP